MAQTSKPKFSEEEDSFEKIDQAKEKVDTFSELVLDIVSYIKLEEQIDLKDPQPFIKERLAIERKLKKYQEQNTPDWLFNLILRISNTIK